MCVLPKAGKHIAVWHFYIGELVEGRKAIINSVAKERIEILFRLAEKVYPEDSKLAGSYISMLNSIRAHYKVPAPSWVKNRICSVCSSVLIPGLNCRVVLAGSRGHAVYKCTVCKAEKHVRYKKADGPGEI